ncbi:MAG: nucleotidyltransferase domain-containing protein [Rhodocyclaceae bacterium]|nr:nucleotidyltransferase domain-containing protein [Rhodocyclaceae bacterium]
MRLAPAQLAEAVQKIHQRLGDVPVWLFGSRVDDAAKGGDIDLYVELPQPVSPLSIARTRGDLADALGQSVDLVVNDGRYERPIYAIARETGVRLA